MSSSQTKHGFHSPIGTKALRERMNKSNGLALFHDVFLKCTHHIIYFLINDQTEVMKKAEIEISLIQLALVMGGMKASGTLRPDNDAITTTRTSVA